MPALSKILQQCRKWNSRHLLGIKDLSKSQIEQILRIALDLKGVPVDQLRKAAPLKGRRIFNFFVESSTRTKISFGIAARQLGAEVLDFSPGTSSLNKGESLKDTAKTIESMGVDFAVIRHPSSGAPEFLSRQIHGAVINAGDGASEHPTQALLDLLTIREATGRINRLKIALIGDIAHSRVARSNIWLHQKLGNEVTVCGPATLIPAGLPVTVSHDLDAILEKQDVVMMLRLQKERQEAGLLPSIREFSMLFGMTRERLDRLGKNAILMHPGPMNRGVEIAAEAADSHSAVILDQVGNGVVVRMAVLLLLKEALR